MATGITTRHHRRCPSREGGKCGKPCVPTHQAWVWSARDSKRIYETFPTVSAARSWRSDAQSAIRNGTMRAPSQLTLRDAWTAWLEAAKAGEIRARHKQPYKPSTLRTYEHDLKTYVLDDLGAHRLSDVRADDLQALVDRLLGKGLSGSKVRNVLVPVQALYRRHRRTVTVNPTEGLDLPESSGTRERAASPAEAVELIDVLPEGQQALWATAFYAGLRRGELRALKCSDVNWPAATTITVQRGWDDVEGVIAPKSKKGARIVPIAGVLRRYLLAHKMRTGRDGDDFLFGRTAREPFTPTHVRKQALEAWAVAAVVTFFRGESPAIELVPIGLHECRHTYVSLMHAAGCSLEEIGDFVGHSSTYMTDRYRHLIDGQREKAADRLDSFLTAAHTAAQPARTG
jgi:integrase